VADALRKEPGVEVEVVNGKRGELTVQVDGRTVATKVLFFFKPSVEKVLKTVRQAGPNKARA
jgi:hypothetical protein